MNPAPLVLVLALASASTATIIFSVVTTTTATALTAAQATSLVAGVGLVKALAVGALAGGALIAAASRGRGRREAEDFSLAKETDAIFNIIQDNEPAQCVQRLICDLGTGLMPPSENDVIMSLFESEVAEDSPMHKFAVAAQEGKLSRDVKKCELQYSCPINGIQMEQLLSF